MTDQLAYLLNTDKWRLHARDKIDAENCNGLLQIEIERLNKELKARMENSNGEEANMRGRPMNKDGGQRFLSIHTQTVGTRLVANERYIYPNSYVLAVETSSFQPVILVSTRCSSVNIVRLHKIRLYVPGLYECGP